MDNGGVVDVGGAEMGAVPDGDTETGLAGMEEMVSLMVYGARRVVISYADSSRDRRLWRSSKTEDGSSGDAIMVSRAITLCVAVVMSVVTFAKRVRTSGKRGDRGGDHGGDEMETVPCMVPWTALRRSPLLFFLTLVDGCSSSGGGDPGRPLGWPEGRLSLSHTCSCKTNNRTSTFFCPGCFFASAVTVAARARWVWYSSEDAFCCFFRR